MIWRAGNGPIGSDLMGFEFCPSFASGALTATLMGPPWALMGTNVVDYLFRNGVWKIISSI